MISGVVKCYIMNKTLLGVKMKKVVLGLLGLFALLHADATMHCTIYCYEHTYIVSYTVPAYTNSPELELSISKGHRGDDLCKKLSNGTSLFMTKFPKCSY
jgi:hypothetical protein